MKKYFMIVAGCIAAALGFIGVILPVLPTTPFLLLAAFLFSGSSERFHSWLQGTRAYGAYVEPLKKDGGISRKKKAHILCTTYGVMLVSGIIVREWHAIVFMSAVALWLLWYIGFRIKTVEKNTVYDISASDCLEDVQELLDKKSEDREAL